MTRITSKILILFVIPCILYIVLLPAMPLMEPDEGRYSSIPHTMNESGDYITPRLKGVVYIEKPPFVYWATALSFKLFGENEFSSRLFAGLCAWGCILLVYAMGNLLGDYRTGLYSAAILTTSLFHFFIGRINILDMPVTFFLSAATWAGYRYFAGTHQAKWIYLFYFACGLAFLTKGLIGIVLPAGIIIIWLCSLKRWREVLRMISPLGVIIFLMVSLPWLILIQEAHSDFFRFFFIQEHFQRYTTTIHRRVEPFYYYVPFIIFGTLPWCTFLYRPLKSHPLRQVIGWGLRKEENLFLLIWVAVIILFFTLSSSKMIPYIAPVFLPLSLFGGRIFHAYETLPQRNTGETFFQADGWLIMIQSLLVILGLIFVPFANKRFSAEGWWLWISAPIALQVACAVLPDYLRRKTGGNWFVTIYAITSLFLASILLPLAHFITPYKSAYPLAQAVKRYVPAGVDLYQFGMSLYGLDFYNNTRTPIVDDIGEVDYGSKFLSPAERSRYFLNSQEFFSLCKKQPVTYCAVKGAETMEKVRKGVPHTVLLWDNRYYFLLRVERDVMDQ